MKKEIIRIKSPKQRIPLPKQTEKTHKSDKDYNRQKKKQIIDKDYIDSD